MRQFTQGAIQTTAGLLDAAVQGDGFFVVKDDAGNTLYTRAGNFQADKYGNLLTDTGSRVQGWTTIDSTTGEVDTNGPIGNIIVPVGSLKAPTVTSQFTRGPQPELLGERRTPPPHSPRRSRSTTAWARRTC